MYNLLLGGYATHVSYVSFDPSTAKIKVEKESSTPDAVSWLDPSAPLSSLKVPDGGQAFYTLSEVDKGLGISLELKGQDVKVTAKVDAQGSPAHLAALRDGSGVVLANYMGGNVLHIPTTTDHALDTSSKLEPLTFPYVYKDTQAPNPDRQEASHPHQVIDGPGGVLYIPDLGNDRVWVVERDPSSDSGLKVQGHFQCPPGSGPRHGVISKDEKTLYILTELTQTIMAFPISSKAVAEHAKPIFTTNIAPPSVPESHYKYLGAAELLMNPNHPGTLYASNRLELHIKESDPSYKPSDPNVRGDAVAIVKLSDAGDQVEDTKWVRTTCDHIRGMMVSPDGKYVALAGKDAGGVEIWAVGGSRGEDWKLAAKDESLEKVTTFVWL